MSVVIAGQQATFTGKWAMPKGWRPVWYWTGTLTEGVKGGAVVQWPDLVLCRNPGEVQAASARGWTPADQMPIEVQQIALACYGEDLTDDLRAICSQAIAAQKQKKAAAPKKAAPAKKKPAGRKR